MRAEKSGIHLTAADAAIAKGMIERGDRQHDIAAWFGVNGGRIAEISTGQKFEDVQLQTHDLPPPGPYLSGRAVKEARAQLIEARSALSKVIGDIDSMIEHLDH